VTYQSFPHDRPLPGKLRGMGGRQLLAGQRPLEAPPANISHD